MSHKTGSKSDSRNSTFRPPQPKRARVSNSPHSSNGAGNLASTESAQIRKTGAQSSEDLHSFRALNVAHQDTTLSLFGPGQKCLPCLCRVPEEVTASDDLLLSCQAEDSVKNTIVQCTNSLSSCTPNLVRSHICDRFKALCDNHLARIRLHQCCPGCGLFCLKGRFNKCYESDQPHYFHLTCANELGQCPHCLSTSFSSTESDLTTMEPQVVQSSARIKFPQGGQELFSLHNEFIVRQNTHRISVSGGEKEICIAYLAEQADREAIRKAINELDRSVEVNSVNLDLAMTNNDLNLLLSLLAKDVDPDTRLVNGLTLLQYAASTGLFLISYVLIALGATVDAEEPETGRTALMMASNNCHYGICSLLVKYGKANVLMKDRSNDTALHLASKAGSAEIVRFLIYGGHLPTVDEQDYGGWTALMWAAENGQAETVEILLLAGAKTGLIDSEGNIALHWAAMSGIVDVGRLLTKHNCPEQVNKQNSLGYTPLMIACRENHKAFIELLLANGADPTIEDGEQKTAETYLRNHVESDDDPGIILIQMMHKMIPAGTANRNRKKMGLIMPDLSKGKERVRINVYNDIDSETVDEFVYVTAPIETSVNTKVDRHCPESSACSCVEGCGLEAAEGNECACALGMTRVWYDENGRLAPDFPFGGENQPQSLFECNPLCRCSATCRNRVVQRGISVCTKLVKTPNKGWGLFADEDIPRGTFICEYAGELITDREAEQRNEDVYLFELIDMTLPNAKEITNWLCIDSCKYGNISRFVNHGCESNLFPIKVFYDHVDPRAPHVAFFAAKDIHKDEEITFDYGPKFWGVKGQHFSCKCRSPNCLYSEEKMEEFLGKFVAEQQERLNEF